MANELLKDPSFIPVLQAVKNGATFTASDGDSAVWGTLQLDANGNLEIAVQDISTPAAFFSGTKDVTTAGTQEALAGAQALQSGVTIKAKAGNSGNVYVQNSGDAAGAGFILAAGEQVFVEVADLATVYLDVDTSGEGVSYIAS
jgi:hypothetical protein